jgi:hypothetical protein
MVTLFVVVTRHHLLEPDRAAAEVAMHVPYRERLAVVRTPHI